MSTNLDILSDSTFGTKLDTQNGILEDIKDGLTGGSNAVTAGTPDADSVVQLKKKDPVSGNDVNVYPALAPASGLGRYLFPALPSEIDWTNWNSPECVISVTYSAFSQSTVITPSIYKKTFGIVYSGTPIIMLFIRRDLIDPNSNLTVGEARFNLMVNFTTTNSNVVQGIYPYNLYTVNNTEYFAYQLYNSNNSDIAYCPQISLIV